MKRILTGLSLLAGFYAMAQQRELNGSKLSLQQCVQEAINNNLDVRQTQLRMLTARVNWNQAKMNQLPDLMMTTGSGVNQGRSIDPFTNSYIDKTVNYSNYNISSGLILFSGGALRNSARQNELGYEAARLDWQQMKDNITIDVILAYLEVLRSEDLRKQAEQQAELSLKQVERLEIMNREGAVSPGDLYDLRGQYANDQLAIINANNTMESAKVQLSKLMNVLYRPDLQLERLDNAEFSERYEGSPGEIYQETLQQFAQVKSVALKTRSAAFGVRANRSLLFPTLSLNGGFSTNYSSAARNNTFLSTGPVASDDYVVINGTQTPVIRQQSMFEEQKIRYTDQLQNNRFSSISLNLRIPIFTNLQTRNRIRLARIELKNAEYVEDATLTQLQQSVELAYINLQTASKRYHTLTEQVAAYKEFYRAAEILFNEGVGNSIDYLTSKNKLDQANINFIVARYDYVLRTKILDYYRGRMLW